MLYCSKDSKSINNFFLAFLKNYHLNIIYYYTQPRFWQAVATRSTAIA